VIADRTKKEKELIKTFAVVVALGVGLIGCAGTVGLPENVQQLLTSKYVGQSVQTVIVDLGTPSSMFNLGDGTKSLTWRRQSAKYANNLFIKSDERCVVTMLTDTTGNVITSVGKVDDSLGAFQLSYCKEQLGL